MTKGLTEEEIASIILEKTEERDRLSKSIRGMRVDSCKSEGGVDSLINARKVVLKLSAQIRYLKNHKKIKKQEKERWNSMTREERLAVISSRDPDKVKESAKRHRIKNADNIKADQAARYKADKEARKAYSSCRWKNMSEEGRDSRREKARDRKAKRKAEDPGYKVRCLIESRVRSAVFAVGAKKKASTADMVGCSWEFLRAYIETRFEDGMSWENHGHDTWHIDHIVPLSSFDLTKLSEQKKANHYTNLQPMWALDNQKKYNKVEIQQELL